MNNTVWFPSYFSWDSSYFHRHPKKNPGILRLLTQKLENGVAFLSVPLTPRANLGAHRRPTQASQAGVPDEASHPLSFLHFLPILLFPSSFFRSFLPVPFTLLPRVSLDRNRLIPYVQATRRWVVKHQQTDTWCSFLLQCVIQHTFMHVQRLTDRHICISESSDAKWCVVDNLEETERAI